MIKKASELIPFIIVAAIMVLPVLCIAIVMHLIDKIRHKPANKAISCASCTLYENCPDRDIEHCEIATTAGRLL